MRVRRGLSAALAVLLAAALCCGGTVRARAAAFPSGTGSITVTLQDEGTAVSGGTLELYKVGELNTDGSTFSLSSGFGGSGIDLSGITISQFENADVASALVEYAEENDVKPVATATVGSNGVATFTGVDVGLYVVVQGTTASGYEAISPFLVSMPWLVDNSYDYTIEAEPKVEPTPTPEPSPDPEPSPEPEPEPTPDPEPDPEEPDEPDEPGTDEPGTDEPGTDEPDDTEVPEDPTPDGPKQETPTPDTTAEQESKIPETGTPSVLVPVLSAGGVGLALVGCSLFLSRRGGDRAE